MTDDWWIAHLRITHQVANPEVGNPDIQPFDGAFTLLSLKIFDKLKKSWNALFRPVPPALVPL